MQKVCVTAMSGHSILLIIMGYFIGLLIAFDKRSYDNIKFQMIWRKPHA